jgi:hypothetical protein
MSLTPQPAVWLLCGNVVAQWNSNYRCVEWDPSHGISELDTCSSLWEPTPTLCEYYGPCSITYEEFDSQSSCLTQCKANAGAGTNNGCTLY